MASGFGFTHVMGGIKSKTVVALCSSTRRKTHASSDTNLSAEQATCIIGVLVLLLSCPAVRGHARRASTRPGGIGWWWWRLREPCHSPRSRDCTIRQALDIHYYHSYLSDEDSRRLRHVLADARDRRGRGERQPSSREVHTAYFLSRPTNKASSACALSCSGAADTCACVRHRAIAVVDYFLRER